MKAAKAEKRSKLIFLSETGTAFLLFAVVFIVFLAFPRSIRRGVSCGLDLCVSAVLPSLFPYAVLASFFVIMGYSKWVARPFEWLSARMFCSTGELLSLWLTGVVAGFPIGGRTAAKSYIEGQIDCRTAENAAAFSNCPSPAFVIAFCGGLFESPYAGIALFLILLISSLLTGMAVCRLFRRPCGYHRPGTIHKEGAPSAVASFCKACVSGGETMVTVCSYVVFFSAFLALAEDTVFHLLPADGILMAFLRGSFELTAGISSLGTIFSTEYVKFVAAAFMLSFSGLCANMQVIYFIKEAGLSVKPYVVGRGVMIVVCVLISLIAGLIV